VRRGVWGFFVSAASANLSACARRSRSQRALSPVMASVVMASVTAAFVVLANFLAQYNAWQYVDFEMVEIQSSNCVIDRYGNWNITLKIKNTGGSTVTFVGVLINEEEVSTYCASDPTTALTTYTTNMTKNPAFTIKSGQTRIVNIWIGKRSSTLSSGTTVSIKLYSSAGKDYMKMVVLV